MGTIAMFTIGQIQPVDAEYAEAVPLSGAQLQRCGVVSRDNS
jgi:hypothetical protein